MDWSLGAALQLQSIFSGIAERVTPSVVSISAWQRGEPAARGDSAWRGEPGGGDDHPGFHRARGGSGFIVSTDGYILSARHVLVDPVSGAEPDLIDVELHNNRRLRARLVAAEPTLDLAILKVEPRQALRAVSIGDSDAIQVGHWAIALGDPEGAERTFAPGTVAGLPQRECYQEELTATLFQTSYTLHPESYGGPVVNIRGEVIGISRPRVLGPVGRDGLPILTPLSGAHALPIKLAMTIYEPLVVLESRRSPWLGFSVLPIDAQLRARLGEPRLVGIYIDDVFEPSPATRIGVRVGDVLTRIDGERVAGVPDFQRRLYLAGIGRKVELELWRDGALLTREVEVEERPPEAAPR